MRVRRSWRGRLGDLPVALTFLVPAVLAAVLLRLWPTCRALWDSLHSSPLGIEPTHWVGLAQFRALLSDPDFLNSLKVTALFGIVVNPLQILLALVLAVVLNERIRGAGVMRTLVFLPVAIPQSVSAVIWAVAFRPDGPLNGLLARAGIAGQGFLTAPDQALASIILVVSWIGVGYWMMFLIAGLKEIDPQLYEAAALDGAGRWARFRHVTIPQLSRQLTFVLVADTVSNLLVFAPVNILTDGGPNGRTDLIMNDVFDRAYNQGDLGAAAAGTCVVVVIALAVVLIQFRLLNRGGG
ncbi:carbohydrate ABC transporter permease [Actinoplanes teichomyceticus]|uniref:Carbohydrate ABC transporter membrane protein 1 (CUT1 family) n=1 Tax=Actinoplanes teichomyceticus TaxID=1867 RepID=A0A561WBB9_ACTTI|nr:sugar ABC transporter permease [Actinoplanes teichomyceticus]TWG21160.1 carbohydrate ABC transporter membrane protein 1 (CUT1 family) [Actinoplanes teichomyceticus]GIF14982.1 ABC transporter permease [Actinoplanes teichomyceticus]